jgi:hypothetical protein
MHHILHALPRPSPSPPPLTAWRRQSLIDCRVDLNAKNRDGNTALERQYLPCTSPVLQYLSPLFHKYFNISTNQQYSPNSISPASHQYNISRPGAAKVNGWTLLAFLQYPASISPVSRHHLASISPSSHQYLTSISRPGAAKVNGWTLLHSISQVSRQYLTNTTPVLQYLTSISPVSLQYLTSISPVLISLVSLQYLSAWCRQGQRLDTAPQHFSSSISESHQYLTSISPVLSHQ